MSHSRKKFPGFVDRNPFAKNQANRRVRRFKGEVGDGGWYKKNYDQWDICDWSHILWTNRRIQNYDKDQRMWNKGPFCKSSYLYRLYMK